MKYAPNFELISSGQTPEELEAAKDWIAGLLDIYVDNNLAITTEYYEETGFLDVIGIGPAVGTDALNKCYEWLYKGHGGRRLTFTLKIGEQKSTCDVSRAMGYLLAALQARIEEGQFVFSADNLIPLPTGDITINLDFVAVKALKDIQMKSLTVSGDTDKMLEVFAIEAGPLPKF